MKLDFNFSDSGWIKRENPMGHRNSRLFSRFIGPFIAHVYPLPPREQGRRSHVATVSLLGTIWETKHRYGSATAAKRFCENFIKNIIASGERNMEFMQGIPKKEKTK
jgi:hypothetical protein